MNKLSKIIYTFFGLFILFLLINQINFNNFGALLKKINIIYLLFGLLIYWLTYLLRAFRFYFILSKKIKLIELIFIVMSHNIINNVLPFRLGEASYPILAKKIGNINIKKGIGSLIIARFYDFLSILIILLISLSFYFLTNFQLIISLIFIGIFSIIPLLFFDSFMGFIVNLMKKLPSIFDREQNLFFKILKYLKSVMEEILLFGKFNNRFLIFGLSFFIWFFMYLISFVLLVGFGINISIWVVFIGSTIAFLTSILPIQSFLNLGTFEAMWTLAFVNLGFSREEAISTSLLVHFVLIVYLIISLIPALIFKFILSFQDKNNNFLE